MGKKGDALRAAKMRNTVYTFTREQLEAHDKGNPMTDLDHAITVLREEYDRATRLDFVRDPLGYALYQTWKKHDMKEGDTIGRSKLPPADTSP